MAFRRLMKEYKDLIENAPEGVSAGPLDEEDFLVWEALIDGPVGSPYEGGVFRAQVRKFLSETNKQTHTHTHS